MFNHTHPRFERLNHIHLHDRQLHLPGIKWSTLPGSISGNTNRISSASNYLSNKTGIIERWLYFISALSLAGAGQKYERGAPSFYA